MLRLHRRVAPRRGEGQACQGNLGLLGSGYSGGHRLWNGIRGQPRLRVRCRLPGRCEGRATQRRGSLRPAARAGRRRALHPRRPLWDARCVGSPEQSHRAFPAEGHTRGDHGGRGGCRQCAREKRGGLLGAGHGGQQRLRYGGCPELLPGAPEAVHSDDDRVAMGGICRKAAPLLVRQDGEDRPPRRLQAATSPAEVAAAPLDAREHVVGGPRKGRLASPM
mmetsp:Transcript_21330/g.53878  ORF Transcript_21330/g.53878 Transcript_21330/m.53878 type:complete len:221 (+) Transcript_21330:933-1595(+)